MNGEDTGAEAGGTEYVAIHVARTPTEANLIRALLVGAGIPAHVEGGMLADEFAVSQRLMNVRGVRVFVLADRVEHARELLAEAPVSDEELEEQALSAAGEPGAEAEAERSPQPLPDAARPTKRSMLPLVTVLFALLTVLFFALWVQSRQGGEDPLYVFGTHDDGVTWHWRHNGAEAVRQYDRDRNLVFEEIRYFDRDGRLLAVSYDADEDGLGERFVEHRADGLRVEWLDDDGDGRHDRCRIESGDGVPIRELRYAGERGFVEERPR